MAILIVYISNEWNTVLVAITIYVGVAYFCLEYLIWNDDFTKNPKSKTNEDDEPEEEEDKIFHVFWNNKAIYFNTVILSSIWFMVCLNFYGLFRSWCKVGWFNLGTYIFLKKSEMVLLKIKNSKFYGKIGFISWLLFHLI